MKNRLTRFVFGLLLTSGVSSTSLWAANLNIEYVERENATITRNAASADSVKYKFELFDSGSEVTDAGLTGFTTRVCENADCTGGNDVSSDFDIGAVTWDASGPDGANSDTSGSWVVTVSPKEAATVQTGYFIEIEKSLSGGHEISSPNIILSKDTTVGANEGLGATNGVFEVQNSTLTINYITRNNSQIRQHDGAGTTYEFDIYFPNQTSEFTGPSSDLTIRVYDKNDIEINRLESGSITGTGNFDISGLAYSLGKWQVTIEASASETVDTGYYISVERTSDDTLTEKPSNDADTGDDYDDGLGTTNGVFEVQGGLLSIVFESRTLSQIAPNSGTPTVYTYYLEYSDGSTRADNSTDGYTLQVLDSSNVAQSGGEFTVNAPVYSGGSQNWTADVLANGTATIATGYKLEISKAAGTDGATLTAARSDNGTNLDGTTGVVEVLAADLQLAAIDVTYDGGSDVTVGDDTEYVQFRYRVYFDDDSTEHSVFPGNYSFVIRDSTSTDVTSDFEQVNGPLYNDSGVGSDSCGDDAVRAGDQSGTSCWGIRFRAYGTASAASGYYLEVSKASGAGDTETLAASNTNGAAPNGIGSPAGEFTVIDEPDLDVVFRSRSTAAFNRVDGTGITYFYSVLFQSGESMNTEGANHTVDVRRSGASVTVSEDFTVAAPTYVTNAACAPAADCWSVNVQAGTGTTPQGAYLLRITKTAGTSQTSSNHDSDDGDSLSGAAGQFTVNEADLAITYGAISANTIEQAAGTGVTYNFRVFYEDGATQHDDTIDSNYTITVYNSGGGDITGDFTLGTLSYINAATGWEIEVTPDTSATVASDNYIGVERLPAETDNLTEETTQNPGDLADGEFDVTNTALDIVYRSRSSASIIRQDSMAQPGITFYYNLFYGDGTTEDSGDSQKHIIEVLRGSPGSYTTQATRPQDNAGDFDTAGPALRITEPSYGAAAGCAPAANCWQVNVKAFLTDGATVAGDYAIRVSKTDGGTSGDTLVAFASGDNNTGGNVGLGSGDNFAVTDGDLVVVYDVLSTGTISRGATSGLTFEWNVYNAGGSPEITNVTGFTYTVHQVSDDADVTTQFDVSSGITYSVDHMETTILALAAAGGGGESYYIQVAKATVPILNAYDSNASTTPDGNGNTGLGAGVGNGAFQVADATNLNVNFESINNSTIVRQGTTDAQVYYRLLYENGEQMDTEAHNVDIRRGVASELANFNITGGPAHATYGAALCDNASATDTDCWRITIQAQAAATIATDYFVRIDKTTGTDQTSASHDSNDGDDLAGAAGQITVDYANLTAVFAAPTVATSIERWDAAQTVTIAWDVFYPDGTEATNAHLAAGDFNLTINDNTAGTVDRTGEFTVDTALTYTGGRWEIVYRGTSGSTTPSSTYNLEISDDGGGTHDVIPTRDSDTDLGGTGFWEVISHDVVYTSRRQGETGDGSTVKRAPGASEYLIYEYNILADSAGAPETGNAGDQTLRILDTAGGGADVTARFTVASGPTYFGDSSCQGGTNCWRVELYPNGSGTVAPITGTGSTLDDYVLEVTKALGSQASFANTKLANDAGELGAGGGFDVIQSNMTITYLDRTDGTFEKLDAAGAAAGTTYEYRIFYEDGTTQFTDAADAASFAATIHRGTSTAGADDADLSGQFGAPAIAYNAGVCAQSGVTGCWEAQVQTTVNTETPDQGGSNFYEHFYIQVSKAAGTTGDIVAAYGSSAGTSSGNVGLGTGVTDGDGNGEFRVDAAALSVTFLSRDTGLYTRADGVGVNYYFRVEYPDAATEHTTNGGDYSFVVYDSGSTDQSTDFTVTTPPTYAAHAGCGGGSCWEVNVQATDAVDTTYWDDYYISVQKAVNGADNAEKDTLAETDSNNGTNLTTNGEFDVANLRIDYTSVSSASIERGDSTGTTIAFNVFYPDGSTFSGATGDFTVEILDNTNANAAAEFDAPSLVDVGVGDYELTLTASETATIAAGYRVRLSRTIDTTDYLIAYRSNQPNGGPGSEGLGSPGGEFAIVDSTKLKISYQSRTTSSVERGSAVDVTYAFRAYYPDDTAHTDTSAPNGYEVEVLDTSNNTIATGFTIGAITYNGGASNWEFTVTPDHTVDPSINNYKVMVRKTSTGANPDETVTDGTTVGSDRYADPLSDGNGGYLLSTASVIDTEDQGLGAGLGGAQGEFEVNDATLNYSVGTELTPTTAEQADSATIAFAYTLAYDNGTTLTNAIGGGNQAIIIREDDESGAILYQNGGTENVDVTGPVEAAGVWTWTITVRKDSPVYGTYVVCLSVADAGTGATPNADAYATPAGCSAASFAITEATLNAAWNAPTGSPIARGADKSAGDINFTVDIEYDNGTDVILDTDVGDIATEFTVEIQQSASATDLSHMFQWHNGTIWVDADPDNNATVDNPVKPFWNGSEWEVQLAPKYLATVQDYEVNLAYDGTLGTINDTLAAGDSANTFTVDTGVLDVEVTNRAINSGATASFERADGALGTGGTTYYYTTKWPDADAPFIGDGVNQSSVDSATYGLLTPTARFDGSGTDESANFLISGGTTSGDGIPVFGNYTNTNCGAGVDYCWRVNIVALPAASVADDYVMGLEKSAGDDQLSLLRSDDGTDGLGDGLAAGQGEFQVQIATLNIFWESLSNNSFDRAEVTGTDYFFRIFYDDMTTQFTDNSDTGWATAGNIAVHAVDEGTGASLGDESANFTVGGLAYGTNSGDCQDLAGNEDCFSVNILSLVSADFGGYMLKIEKDAGTSGDTIDGKYSSYVSNAGSDEAIESNGTGLDTYTNPTTSLDPDDDDLSKTFFNAYGDWDTADDGIFKVTYEQQLRLAYLSRSVDRFRRNDATGTDIYFRVVYSNNDDFSDSVQNYGASDWTITIHDAGDVDVTAQFDFDATVAEHLEYSNYGAGLCDEAATVPVETDCWRINVKGITGTTDSEEDYYVKVEKPDQSGGGGSGDVLAAKDSNDSTTPDGDGSYGLGTTNGVWATTNVVVEWISRTNASMEYHPADDDRVIYRWDAFNDTTGGTEVTGANFDGSWGVVVRDLADADVTADFDVVFDGTGLDPNDQPAGTPTYVTEAACGGDGSCWKFITKAVATTDETAGPFYITLDPDYTDAQGGVDTALPYNSKDPVTAGITPTGGLGDPAGTYTVTEATLNVEYTHRNGPDQFEKADGVGIDFYYVIFYDDRTAWTTADGNQTVRVYDDTLNLDDESGSGNAGIFNFGPPSVQYNTYTTTECATSWDAANTDCWETNVQAGITAESDNYYISVDKLDTSSQDTLAEYDSNASTTPDDSCGTGCGNAGLGTGISNGDFQVINAKLLVKFSSQTNETVEKGTTGTIRYEWDIFYKDEVTEETGTVSYYVRVYDSGDNNITEDFIGSSGAGATAQINLSAVGNYVNSGGSCGGDAKCWRIDLQPIGSATVSTDNYVIVRGTHTGATLGDLGSGEDADCKSTDTSVATIPATGKFHTGLGASSPDGDFDITPTTLHVVYRQDGSGLTGSPVQRLADTADGALYQWKVYYPVEPQEESSQTGYVVTVHADSDDSDVTNQFDFYCWTTGGNCAVANEWDTTSNTVDEAVHLQYASTYWQIKLRPHADTTLGDYYIKVDKASGGAGNEDTIPVVNGIESNLSTTPDGQCGGGCGNQGLDTGSDEGNFTVDPADLAITYADMDATSIGRADGNDVTFSYVITFPDGTPADNAGATAMDTNSFTIGVHDAAQALEESAPGDTTTSGTGFTITSMAYGTFGAVCDVGGGETDCWQASVSALAPDAGSNNVGTNYQLGLVKVGGTDGNLLAIEYSEDSGDLGAAGNGNFDVTNSALTIVWTDKDTPQAEGSAGYIELADTGADYQFTVTYPDTTTQEANDYNYVIEVWEQGDVAATDTFNTSFGATYPADGSNRVDGTDFSMYSLIYNTDHWELNIRALPSASIANYYLRIQKGDDGGNVNNEGDTNTGYPGTYVDSTGSTTLDATLTENTGGLFHVTTATLNITYIARDVTAIERIGAQTNYFYRMYYDDMTTQHAISAADYRVTVYDDGGTDIGDTSGSGLMNINEGSGGDPVYASYAGCGGGGDCWRATVSATGTAVVDNDYRLGISKVAGDNSDFLPTDTGHINNYYLSDLTTGDVNTNNTGLDNGLAAGQGEFEVTDPTLNVKYTARVEAAHGRHVGGVIGDGAGNRPSYYFFHLVYDNDTTQAGPNAGEGQVDITTVALEVLDQADTDESGDFKVGTDGSNVAGFPEWVTDAANCDTTGLGITNEADSCFRVRVEGTATTSFSDSGDGTDYYKLNVTKTAGAIGSEPASLTGGFYADGSGTASGNDSTNIAGATGRFDVDQATLTVDGGSWTRRHIVQEFRDNPGIDIEIDEATIERVDLGSIFRFQVLFPDGVTNETAIQEGYQFEIRETTCGGTDRTSQFMFYNWGGTAYETLPAASGNNHAPYVQYNASNFEVKVQATDTASVALSDLRLCVDKVNSGTALSEDLMAATESPGTADLDITGANLSVKFSAISAHTVARGDTASTLTYGFDAMYGDNTTEYDDSVADYNSANWTVTVYDDNGGAPADVTSDFTVSTPSWSGTVWEVTLSANGDAAVSSSADAGKQADEYYIDIAYASATDNMAPEGVNGTLEADPSPFYSIESTTTTDHGSIGLGPNAAADTADPTTGSGAFDVTPGVLHIVYSAPSNPFNTQIRRLNQGDFTEAAHLGFTVSLGDGIEEVNDTGFSVVIRDSTSADVTANFDFWDWTSGATNKWDTGSAVFDETKHLNHSTGAAGGIWQLSIRPKKSATVYSGAATNDTYTVEISKAAGTEGDTLPVYGSNESTTPDASGNTGLDAGGNEGQLTIQGARLYVQHLNNEKINIDFSGYNWDNYDPRDFRTFTGDTYDNADRDIQRGSNGTRYSFQVYYPDGTEETQGAANYTIEVFDTSDVLVDSSGTGDVIVDPVIRDSGIYYVVVRPRPGMTAADDYYIRISKTDPATADAASNYLSDTANTLGDVDGTGTYYATSQLDSEDPVADNPAVADYVNQGFKGLAATGRFDVENATLHVQFAHKTSEDPLTGTDKDGTIYRGAFQAGTEGRLVRYKFRLMYSDNFTQATDTEMLPTQIGVVLWDRNASMLPFEVKPAGDYNATSVAGHRLRVLKNAYANSDTDCNTTVGSATAGGAQAVDGCWSIEVNANTGGASSLYEPPVDVTGANTRSLAYDVASPYHNLVGVQFYVGIFDDSGLTETNFATGPDIGNPGIGGDPDTTGLGGQNNTNNDSMTTVPADGGATGTTVDAAGGFGLGAFQPENNQSATDFPAIDLGGTFTVTFSKELFVRYYQEGGGDTATPTGFDNNSIIRGGGSNPEYVTVRFNMFNDQGNIIGGPGRGTTSGKPTHPDNFQIRVRRDDGDGTPTSTVGDSESSEDVIVYDSANTTGSDQFELVPSSIAYVNTNTNPQSDESDCDAVVGDNDVTGYDCHWSIKIRALAPTVYNTRASDRFYITVQMQDVEFITETSTSLTSDQPYDPMAVVPTGLGSNGEITLTNNTTLSPSLSYFGGYTDADETTYGQLASFRRGDDTGINFTFNFHYDNNAVKMRNNPSSLTETNAIKVFVYQDAYDENGSNITDIDASSDFTITDPEFLSNDTRCQLTANNSSDSCWLINIQAGNESLVPTDRQYYIVVYKVPGLTRDESNVGLDGDSVFEPDNGSNTAFMTKTEGNTFAVDPAIINATFRDLSPTQIKEGKSTVAQILFEYQNGNPVLDSIDAGNFSVHKFLKRGGGKDLTSDFSNIQPAHLGTDCDNPGLAQNCGLWDVTVTSNKNMKKHSNVGYTVKTAGLISSGAREINEKESTEDINGRYDAGVFYVFVKNNLYQNYPNPFNPEAGEVTKIRFDLENTNDFEVLDIYTASGILVKRFTKSQVRGRNLLIWNGKNDDGEVVGTGVYLAVLKTGSYRKVIKMVVEKQ